MVNVIGQMLQLQLQPPLVERAQHHSDHLLMLEGLGQIVVGAGAQRLHRAPHLGKPRNQDHRQLRVEILGFAH